MCALADQYADYADFVVVYFAEAHAQDEWPLGKTVCINQHKTIEDRISAATFFKENFNCNIPVVVDSMANDFDLKWSVWPERFFIINQHLSFELVGMPGTTDRGYDRTEIVNWLARHKMQTDNVKIVRERALANHDDVRPRGSSQ